MKGHAIIADLDTGSYGTRIAERLGLGHWSRSIRAMTDPLLPSLAQSWTQQVAQRCKFLAQPLSVKRSQMIKPGLHLLS